MEQIGEEKRRGREGRKEEKKEKGRGKRKEVKEELRLETKMCPLPNQAYHQEPSI